MFDERAREEEFLDRPDCGPDLAVMSYRFMERINRHFGGIRVVRRFLVKEMAVSGGKPLRVLDIGSGSGDIPLAVSRWARARHLPLHVTCLEPGDQAAALARRKIKEAGDPSVILLQEDVFSHRPVEPYDVAVSSMCFHHFSDARILVLLERLRGFVREAVLINDLHRTALAYLGAHLLLTTAHPALRHDALLSIRRSFRIRELQDLLSWLPSATVTVTPALWCRIACVVRYTS